MKTTLTVILASALATACGGGSSGGGGSASVVAYEVDPHAGPTCHGPTRRSEFESSHSRRVDCTWYCSDYKGHVNAYVSIDFTRRNQPGATWVKSHEYISDGIC